MAYDQPPYRTKRIGPNQASRNLPPIPSSDSATDNFDPSLAAFYSAPISVPTAVPPDDPDAATDAFVRMRASGVPATVTAFGALVKAWAKSGRMAAAEAVVADMRASGVRPNTQVMSALVDG